MTQEIVNGKWDGFPVYDRPLDAAADGTEDDRPIVTLTVFSACTPVQHIGEPALGCWDLIDYETDSFAGRLLHADRAAAAQDVHLQLGVKGWYAVYVWLMGGDADLEKPDSTSIRNIPRLRRTRTTGRAIRRSETTLNLITKAHYNDGR
jgi:hypothetical protein